MADAFVPFFAQIPLEAQPTGSAPKESFTAVAPASPASPQSPPANHSPSEPHRPVIKLQKDGDRVRSIRIECACGQVIELDCVY